FMRSLSLGKSIDGTIAKSTLLSQATADHRSGKRDLVDDAERLIKALGGADAVRDLSIAKLAQKLAKDGRHEELGELQGWLRRAMGTGGDSGAEK
ncbi:MAG: hypothetical protein KDI51_20765, partial [Xanthomonadales bacterium]|nr:hypothetical protein [Xanthomonadales bacterium]